MTDDPQITHAAGCHAWGPAHYECAMVEVERLRADAGRYRDWLRGGANIPPESTRWARWEVRYWNGRHWITLFAEQMDTAIDAAMGASNE